MALFNAQIVGAEVLRDTMLTIPAITSLVPLGAVPTEFKIFFEHVEDWVEMPYFTIQHLAGGHEQDTQQYAMDAHYKIVITTADMLMAVAAMKALATMHRMEPVLTSYATGNPDSNPVMLSYSTIRETIPLFDRYPVQNFPYFVGGGVYRIRLIQESL